jgi:hypothetical protein
MIHGRVPELKTISIHNHKITISEHNLAIRVRNLIKGYTFWQVVSRTEIDNIVVLYNNNKKTSRLLSKNNFERYSKLINELLEFTSKHNRVPSTYKNKSEYERILYFKWKNLDYGRIFVKYYNPQDREKLLKAGYKPDNYYRYITLKNELFEFVSTHNRIPVVSMHNKHNSKMKYEYDLARRYYSLKNGSSFGNYLTCDEIEEFEKRGIDMYIQQ